LILLVTEASGVIVLRMMKLMRGDKRARRKANLMISEKINAAFGAKRAYQAKLLEWRKLT
jgi:hypothetical protein